MATTYDCADPDQRALGLAAAVASLRRGELVVVPTDTVYGLAADAFTPRAVGTLLSVKGRGPDMPVPVLIASATTLAGITIDVPDAGRRLVAEFWPGPLTVICREQPSLVWDLGDAAGTVAVRVPNNAVATELLSQTGPLAVSSANKTGASPATSCAEARDALGDAVAIYLDDGELPAPVPSSIVDLTGAVPRLVRAGALTAKQLRAVVPELVQG